jgi:CubicO group peptidase (beta-lactamase class C family)
VQEPRFQAVCETAAERWEVPALAVATLVDGRESTVAVGCSPDTRFRVASITKPFTATLAAATLDLDSSTGVWPEEVRVRHLLSHTSGFDGEIGDLARFGDGDDALARAVAELPGARRWFGVDEVWSYGNSGYWLAGWLAAERNGSTYEEALAAHVLRPAGLEATAFDEPDLGGTGPDSIEGRYPRARRPSGGLVSTVGDLIRFARRQLGDPSTAALRVPVAKPVGGVYGLGFFGERVGGEDVWGHPGSYGGFQSSLLLVPSRGAVFVGLTNSGRGAQALAEVEDAWLEASVGARRREAETVSLTADELAAFAGTYENSGMRATVAAGDGGLVADVAEVLPSGEPGESLEIRGRPIGPRTFAVVGGDWDGARFDFPRPGFARLGSRLAERVA